MALVYRTAAAALAALPAIAPAAHKPCQARRQLCIANASASVRKRAPAGLHADARHLASLAPGSFNTEHERHQRIVHVQLKLKRSKSSKRYHLGTHCCSRNASTAPRTCILYHATLCGCCASSGRPWVSIPEPRCLLDCCAGSVRWPHPSEPFQQHTNAHTYFVRVLSVLTEPMAAQQPTTSAWPRDYDYS